MKQQQESELNHKTTDLETTCKNQIQQIHKRDDSLKNILKHSNELEHQIKSNKKQL